MTNKLPNRGLNYSRPIDVHRWSDFPEVTRIIKELSQRIRPSVPESIGNVKLQRLLTVAVVDLWAASLVDPALYIGYARSPNAYKPNSRYNRLHIGRDIIPVIDALAECGFIENHRGSHNRNNPEFSRSARMRATEQLLSLIETSGAKPEMIQTVTGREPIILHAPKSGNARPKPMEYEDTPETIRMRNVVKAYNDLIADTDIRLEQAVFDAYRQSSSWSERPINYRQKFTRRVFNNGRFDYGGRFYGPWWQQCPSVLRPYILIDGELTTEADFGSLHIILLYAMKGINYHLTDVSDAYTLQRLKFNNPEDNARMRKLVKAAFLIAINANTREAANKAIWSKLRQEAPDLLEWMKNKGIKPADTLDAFDERHPAIAEFMCTGIGVKLQYIESCIAEDILSTLTEKNIPVLCIHDSFIVPESKQHELIDAMRGGLSWQIRERLGEDKPYVGTKIKAKGQAPSIDKLRERLQTEDDFLVEAYLDEPDPAPHIDPFL